MDPNCIDGQYTEALPNPSASIQAEVASYSPANFEGFLVAVLQKRYPFGAYIVKQTESKGVNNTSQNCAVYFGQSGSASQALQSLGTVVHECGHTLDLLDLFNPSYWITEDVVFTCQGGSISRFGGQTFSRSLILNDEYAALLKPCKSFNDQDCEDTYAGIYLDGDPDNGQFEGGDQGFDSLLEETVQYVNSLAVAWAFSNDKGPWSSSDRDGILTFLWYVERYLRMARLDFPQTYNLLSGNKCWREAILTTWGRAWMYLEITEGVPGMGINDKQIIQLVRDPDLLHEIQLLREKAGCAAP